jgi:hypothetical protein
LQQHCVRRIGRYAEHLTRTVNRLHEGGYRDGDSGKGHSRYRELSARLLEIASTMGAALSEADIHKTTDIVRRLSDEAKDALASRPLYPR